MRWTPRPLLARMRRSFPRLASAVRHVRPAHRRLERDFADLDTRQVFRRIYEANVWETEETRSGPGSTLVATEAIRTHLPAVLASLQARSLLDIPCGDFHWMGQVDLSALDLYIGADIVPELVADLERSHGTPKRQFRCLDLCGEPLPPVDVILCRDVFLHLSHDLIRAALRNIIATDARHLLASTYPDVTFNPDIRTGLSRPVNLQRPPFSLPPPERLLPDPGVHVDRRALGLWDIEKLRAAKL